MHGKAAPTLFTAPARTRRGLLLPTWRGQALTGVAPWGRIVIDHVSKGWVACQLHLHCNCLHAATTHARRLDWVSHKNSRLSSRIAPCILFPCPQAVTVSRDQGDKKTKQRHVRLGETRGAPLAGMGSAAGYTESCLWPGWRCDNRVYARYQGEWRVGVVRRGRVAIRSKGIHCMSLCLWSMAIVAYARQTCWRWCHSARTHFHVSDQGLKIKANPAGNGSQWNGGQGKSRRASRGCRRAGTREFDHQKAERGEEPRARAIAREPRGDAGRKEGKSGTRGRNRPRLASPRPTPPCDGHTRP